MDSENDVPFLENQQDLRFANGLAYVDREFIKSTRKAGWIMSMKNLWNYIDQTEHYFKVQTTEQVRYTLN